MEQAGRQLVVRAGTSAAGHAEGYGPDVGCGGNRRRLWRTSFEPYADRRARARANAKVSRAGAGPPQQSPGARWGLTPDPKQRVIGLVLLIGSVLALIFLLLV